MGWAALFQAIAQGITNTISTFSYLKETREQAQQIAEQAQAQADERAKKAKYAMQQQKTSFLKSGVYFEGTPTDVINETYDTAREDINAIDKDSITVQKKLKRQGQTAFFTYLVDPLGNNGGKYAEDIYKGFSQNNSKSATTVNSGSTATKTTSAKIKVK